MAMAMVMMLGGGDHVDDEEDDDVDGICSCWQLSFLLWVAPNHSYSFEKFTETCVWRMMMMSSTSTPGVAYSDG